ncbi:MAG: ribose-5-phosphate isomerase RpiA [Gammaproteobacteria bacterium]
MDTSQLKQAAAEAALSYVERNTIIGIGTGSTVNYFIAALAKIKNMIEGTVASSIATEKQLKSLGIPIYDLNSVDAVAVYIDGTDEFNEALCLIKGGGGALTREKIIATAARKFICIADQSKKVASLGIEHPLPVEVISMARSFVARQLVKLGGDPVFRQGVTTDNGNVILDVYNLKIMEPMKLEYQINQIPGVVENGLFAHRIPEQLLCATTTGIQIFKPL